MAKDKVDKETSSLAFSWIIKHKPGIVRTVYIIQGGIFAALLVISWRF